MIPEKCPLCGDRDSECAFVNGMFTGANYNCGTMNRLRHMAGELGIRKPGRFYFRDDADAGSIGIVRVNGMRYAGYIIMTWYKRRLRTDRAVFMIMDCEPQTLTLDIALDAINMGEGGV